jgi:hypothetical protein
MQSIQAFLYQRVRHLLGKFLGCMDLLRTRKKRARFVSRYR